VGKNTSAVTEKRKYGLIYIAQDSKGQPDVIKVGQTTQRIEERMKQLNSPTGVLKSNRPSYSPSAYFVVYDVASAEDACHKALRRYHVEGESFKIPRALLLTIVQQKIDKYRIEDYCPRPENEGHWV
jgi:hypothetical protein